MANTHAIHPEFTRDDVDVLSIEPLYQGFFTMAQYRFRHRLFAGGWSEPMTRELFERGHAAALLPYDPVTDSVVMVEQFRVGALAAECSPWQMEIVAGIIETDEVSEEVVRREAVEEAGVTVSELHKITRYLSSSGGCSETLDIFVGRVDSTTAKGIHGLAEEGEDIRVHVLSREQAYQWVESGKIENAASIIALQWLQLNYARLQATLSPAPISTKEND
ncbi:ADP-ribose diphosphatase [Photobacterium aphoticum]|uniref:ADP-ribose pyrophosphatase n=1 Tax=Photobacterium aphoticum TaxID=754436 RepID=A0A0J1GG65_9GAMM|nr:ADP-ribose diphosphatase [Photobacterium aphoticum]KLU98513.1 ADP-ribose pyrophosphatase [Photobacterium aphoticum]PSU55010.1 ADP-ribose diphosphatase [Photobacterium aphoticum]GHA66148.1 ADP-ribose pyrophosphatase [Photobacterium aphoticum]